MKKKEGKGERDGKEKVKERERKEGGRRRKKGGGKEGGRKKEGRLLCLAGLLCRTPGKSPAWSSAVWEIKANNVLLQFCFK